MTLEEVRQDLINIAKLSEKQIHLTVRTRLNHLSKKKDLNSTDLTQLLDYCAYHALASDDATEMIMINKKTLLKIENKF